MDVRSAIVIFCAAAVSGCAASTQANPFLTERSVFASPYAAPVADDRMIGPKCDHRLLNTEGCWIDGLLYLGRGDVALDRNGNRVYLTRSERRFLQERLDRVQAYQDVIRSLETGLPLPPGSPALPNGAMAPTPSAPASPPQPAPAPDRD